MSAVADDFRADRVAATALPRYPLGLLRCAACTLVQISEIVSDAELWGGDYGFYTGASSVAADYQHQYADTIAERFGDLGRHLTVEIACNDGTMLARLHSRGLPVLGVDPAAGPVEVARARGLDVMHAGFDEQLADLIVTTRGQAGLIVANNVVAHVEDLNGFLAGVRHLLAESGVAIFEFQYLVDLIVGNQFDHVYHEHRQFFSLTSFSRAAERHGLRVLEVTSTDAQGGSLRVTVGNLAHWPAHNVGHLQRAEAWLSDEHALSGLQGRAERIRTRLLEALRAHRSAGRRVAGYGAPSKSSTLLNWCEIDTDLIQYLVDTTPTKQGRFTPGTGIPIISPESDSRLPDVYCVFVWNYLSQVVHKEALFVSHGGRWLVPIPVPAMI